MHRLRWRLVLLLVASVLIAACTSTPDDPSSGRVTAGPRESTPTGDTSGGDAAESEDPGQPDPDEEDGGAEARTPDDEAAEEAELTEKRVEAFGEARRSGEVGGDISIATSPAPGWTGEQLFNADTDDWEPSVAADPRAPYAYLLTTRYGAGKTCPKHCPSPWLALSVSKDGGSTWGKQHPMCVCRGAKAQYDPTIEVVPGTGDVYAAFLNADAGAFSTSFIRSRDHGKTWTAPVHVYGKVAWTDKPEVTSSADGRDVYVSWNGPTGGDLYVGVSHDFGRTWKQHKLSDSKRYYYAYDATTLPNGTVVFSESSLVYGSGGSIDGRIRHHAVISRDGGRTWSNVVVDTVDVGPACVADGCSADYYIGQASVASDPDGSLVFGYEGSTAPGGPQRAFVRRSSDGGRTWSARVALSAPGEHATGPRVDFAGAGEARVWYFQTSGGGDQDRWNVWFRRSTDGGATWSAPVRLSDATYGPGYVHRTGFDEIYGDYGEIAVTATGKTLAAWGEGFSYIGPGGTWFAREK